MINTTATTSTRLPPKAGKSRPSTLTSRLRHWTWRLLRLLLLVYLGFSGLLFWAQGWLIFQGAQTQGRFWARVQPTPGTELVQLTTPRGDRVVALFGPALTAGGRPLRDARDRPTIIYFYGNAECLEESLPEFESCRRLGVNVITPDYVGYGMSGGTASESGCYAAADAAYDYLVSQRHTSPQKIVAAGWSLGAAAAIDLAARRPVAGLAAFSAFSSMADVASRQIPPPFPVSLLLRYRFENKAKIAHVTCPILLVHGALDNLAPLWMADELARSAGGPVTRLTIPNAAHGDIFSTGGERVFQVCRSSLAYIFHK